MPNMAHVHTGLWLCYLSRYMIKLLRYIHVYMPAGPLIALKGYSVAHHNYNVVIPQDTHVSTVQL